MKCRPFIPKKIFTAACAWPDLDKVSRPGACFSKVPKLFGPISGVTIAFISSQRRGSKPSGKLRNPLGFLDMKSMLKDQLFKTSGLRYDNWHFGPEKFS